MGSQNSKDSELDIYMEVNKPFYVAGDYVEGCVYLDVKENRQYKNLVVRLVGKEYVRPNLEEIDDFYEGENSYENYDSVFTLKDFGGNVEKGQRAFPFPSCCRVRCLAPTTSQTPSTFGTT